VAAHLIYSGEVAEGLALVRAVRDRYDGRRRNPWNEVECGSHYARALSSWSLLLALCGFTFSAPEKRLGFAPRVGARDFRGFFTAGTGWGVFRQRMDGERSFDAGIDVRHGEVRLRHLDLQNVASWPGAILASATGPSGALSSATVRAGAGTLRVDLGEETRIAEGQTLALTLRPRTRKV
jgi:hypothetical protein